MAKELSQEGLQEVRLRPGRKEDVVAVARLHIEVLPTAFLSTLGQGFWRRAFRALIVDPDAVVVVAERSGQIIGYAAGVLSMSAFRRRFLLRSGLGVALAVAPRLLRPRTLRRVLESARYPDKTRGLPEAEWALVGVKRGTAPGLGTELGSAVLEALARQGAEEVKAYVASDNRAMNRMVRRMGFEQRAQISLHDGQQSHVYVIRCRPSSRQGSRHNGGGATG